MTRPVVTPHPKVPAALAVGNGPKAIGCPLCNTAWDCGECADIHLAGRHRTTWERSTHPVYPHPYRPAFCDPADCKGI